jgi:hypothetical protein
MDGPADANGDDRPDGTDERPTPAPHRLPRRAILTGGATGLLGLTAGYAAGAADARSPVVPRSRVPADGSSVDLRQFASGETTDYSAAFRRALDAADVVSVPPGLWPVSGPIELGDGKTLWSNAATPLGQDRLAHGAIVRAAGPMPAVVRLEGWGATVAGVIVDGADVATSGIEFAANGLFLDDAVAIRGAQYALKATGDFCRIWGGRFSQSIGRGYAMYQRGSDLLMFGTSVSRGEIPLWLSGSGCVLAAMHVVGIGGEPGPSSTATVRVTGVRNQFVDVYYDTAGAGPNLVLDDGATNNRFVAMTIRNAWSAGMFPAIRCDARRQPVRDNHFEAFMTDPAHGGGWTFLLEQLGSPDALTGNFLGDGHADGCAALWNERPTVVADVSIGGLLTRNAGTVTVGPRSTRVDVAHGLADRPRSVSVTVSSGGAPRPDVSMDAVSISLRWRRAPGPLDVSWQAEL